MSRTPFSRPDVDDLVSGSHIFKKRFSLNNWLRPRLPKARVKHLFGIIAVVLFLFGSQLTACGYSGVSSTGSASSTSIPNTPGSRSGPGSASASTSTAGPTTHPTAVPTTHPTAGPTTHPTAVPTADPTAVPTADPTAHPIVDPTAIPTPDPTTFDVSILGFDFFGAPGETKTTKIKLTDKSSIPIPWSGSVSTDNGGNWLSIDNQGDVLNPGQSVQVTIKATIFDNLTPGLPYTGSVQFIPMNPNLNNSKIDISLTVVSPSPTPTNTPTPTPTTVPSPTPTDTPTPMPPTPTPTDTPTPIPSNTPTPTSIPSMTAHNRFLFRY